MDPVSLIAIISASSALVVAILTHIKYSKCYGFVLRTTEGNETSPTTPTIENNNESSALMKDYKTEPINIPKKSIFTRQNYL
jgi:hypothetical protein